MLLINRTVGFHRLTPQFKKTKVSSLRSHVSSLYLRVQNRNLLHWIIFIALGLTWGSSFILMKLGLRAFTSDQVAALRIFIAFLFFIPFAFKHLKRDLLPYVPAAAGMGIFGNLIPAFLFTKAETMISSALTGMLNSLTPVFTLVLGFFMLRQRPAVTQVIGIFIGLGGAIGLMSLDDDKVNPGNAFFGGALVVIATVFYGLSVNIIKLKLNDVNPVTACVLAFFITGPIAGIYLFATDFSDRLVTQPQALSSLGFVAILGVCGTSLSVIIFNLLIREAGTLFAASVTYLIPVAAMGWGIFDGENVTLFHVFFIIIILSGVWLVNSKKRHET
jgi:drug/metabolite transporter (DMT)-like permease